MQYCLVKHDSVPKVVAHVNKLLSEGWTCQGSIAYTYDPHERVCQYVQAMVKKPFNPLETKAFA